jgi:predicted lipoprotein with Yx(FWY)xxD motif
MTRIKLATIASIAAAALVVAGCGSSKSSSSSSSASKPASSTSSGPKVSATKSSLGMIVVDGQGRTLYLFAKDTGKKSNCSGACATYWPPFTASSKPAIGGGVSSGALTLIKRSDGTKQVAFDGHPLYYYKGDQSAGQVNGQGLSNFGAKWYAVTPAGSQASGSATSGGSSSSRSGGYGGY